MTIKKPARIGHHTRLLEESRTMLRMENALLILALSMCWLMTLALVWVALREWEVL